MKILILAPLHVEYLNFKKSLESRKDLSNNYKVVECGVGKANAAATTATEISGKDYDLVVLIGYAAASNNFSVGDLVIPTNTKYHDTKIIEGIADELLATYQLEGSDESTILTGDCFVDKELAEKLVKIHGEGIIFDMETAAVAQICADQDLEVLTIKFISDIPQNDHNESTFLEFVNNNSDFSAFIDFLELTK